MLQVVEEAEGYNSGPLRGCPAKRRNRSVSESATWEGQAARRFNNITITSQDRQRADSTGSGHPYTRRRYDSMGQYCTIRSVGSV